MEGWRPTKLGESVGAPADSGRGLGSLVHAGMEEYYLGGSVMTGIDKFMLDQDPAAWTKELELAKIMLSGYETWSETEGLDAYRDTQIIEHKFAIDCGIIHGDHVLVTGTLDLLQSDVSLGGDVVVDHKTVQTLTQVPYQANFQLRTYGLGARALGFNVVALEHNMLKKVKQTSRAKPPFYGRHTLSVTDEELSTHQSHLTHGVLPEMVASLQHAEETGLGARSPQLYPNSHRDCSWDCEFVGPCGLVDDGSDYETAIAFGFEQGDQ